MGIEHMNEDELLELLADLKKVRRSKLRALRKIYYGWEPCAERALRTPHTTQHGEKRKRPERNAMRSSIKSISGGA